MQKIYKRVILALLVGLLVSYRVIREIDHEIIFGKEINIVLVIIAMLIFVFIFLEDRKQYIRTKHRSSLIPTFSCVFIILCLSSNLYTMHRRDKSPTRLYCVSKMNDFNGLSIDFREDGTYKLTSWCLGADHYRGAYSINDSIIKLHDGDFEEALISNSLLIRKNRKSDINDSIEESIYQINDKGEIIANATEFRVVKLFNR